MPNDNSTLFSLTNPVATGFFITDPFNSPRPYANGRHEGVDLRALAAGKAVEVVAAQRGIIDRIRLGGTDYGNYVRIRHEWSDGTTWVTWYAHMASVNPTLAVGDVVEAGRRLGIAGSTGNARGVHLHFSLQHLGHGLKGYVLPDVVDPARYFSDVNLPLIDEMTWLADVTVPDGSTIPAEKPFTKIWRVRNTGTSTWDNFTLEYAADDRMDGPESVPLPLLKPNEVGEVSLPLIAPGTPGRHRSTWKPRNGRGRLFLFELFADIIVTPVERRNDAVLIGDITLPPGTKVETNRAILKTWRVRNSGDSTWDGRYRLIPINDPLVGPEFLPLPTVRPGGTADLSVTLNTPTKAGHYRSRWQLRDPEGNLFGPVYEADLTVVASNTRQQDGATFVADITVLDGTRMQPGYTFTKTWRIRNTGSSTWGEGYVLAATTTNSIAGPVTIPLPHTEPGDEADVSIELSAPGTVGFHRSTWQPRSADGAPFGDILFTEIEVVRLGTFDNAVFETDVTFPDETVVIAGERILKTWQIRNTGSSAWGPGYSLVFVADNNMNGPDSVPLPATLPGETTEVTVPLQAPLAPGFQRSTWRARNAEGTLFGDLLYIEIRVPVSSTPGSSAQEDAQLEEHVTIPDGAEIRSGASFEKTWAIRNTGSVLWSDGYELAFVGGAEMGEIKQVSVAGVGPQGVINVSVKMTAPEDDGRHIGRWRMRNPRGDFFGSTIFITIVVVDEPQKFDMLPFMRGDGRLYEMKHIFDMPNGPLIGQQRMQTQREGARFYQTKNSEWEEMWSDERFIYRGTDTSPGSGNFYTLMDGDRYGTVWAPRMMSVGQTYRRSVVVVSRRKGNCVMNSHLSGRHVTWIKLEAMHDRLTLPDVEGRPGLGYKARDVVVMAAYNEVSGRPAERPFEKYYYAKGFGLIMWEGIETDHRGVSFLVQVHNPGDRPDNVREKIPCLDSLRP